MQPGKALNKVRERAAAAAAAAAETAAAAAGAAAAMIVADGALANATAEEEGAHQCEQPSDADEPRHTEQELPIGSLPDAQDAAMAVAA
jgi:hypothetical protein